MTTGGGSAAGRAVLIPRSGGTEAARQGADSPTATQITASDSPRSGTWCSLSTTSAPIFRVCPRRRRRSSVASPMERWCLWLDLRSTRAWGWKGSLTSCRARPASSRPTCSPRWWTLCDRAAKSRLRYRSASSLITSGRRRSASRTACILRTKAAATCFAASSAGQRCTRGASACAAT